MTTTEESGCTICKGDLYRVAQEGELAVARRCDCLKVCPECHGRGLLFRMVDGDRFASPCSCQALDRRLRLFNQARIPGRFAGSWIDNFEPGGRAQIEVKKALLRHRDDFTPGGRGFVLWGPPGVGKTHLLCGLIGYLTIERGIPCRFIEFMQLIMELKAAYAEGRWDSEVIQPLVKVEVLVVDELGKGRASDFEVDILDQLISARYNARLTLHSTTNYSPATPPAGELTDIMRAAREGLAEGLVNRVGQRVFSRLHEMCSFVQVDGSDHRRRRRS